MIRGPWGSKSAEISHNCLLPHGLGLDPIWVGFNFLEYLINKLSHIRRARLFQ